MKPDLQVLIAVALFIGHAYFSLLDNAIGRLTPLEIRLIPERFKDWKKDRILTLLNRSKSDVQVPLVFLVRVLLVAFALVVFNLLSALGAPQPFTLTVAGVAAAVFLSGHLIPWAAIRGDIPLAVRRLSPVFRPFHRLLHPLCYPILVIARRREAEEETEETEGAEATEAEVQAYLDVGEEEGIFEPEEQKLIRQVVEFGDTMVREIMTPRTEITALKETATLQELKDLISQSRHSRIPVYRDGLDTIMGTVHVRHLLAAYSAETANDPIGDMIRPAFFVPETKKVPELLREMQSRGDNLAVVVDEYGGVAGLVTLEDLLEEIVGEIRDEDQHEEEAIVEESPGVFVLKGETEIGRLEERVGVDLYDETYNTAAGMVITHLGRFPAPDETFECRGLRVTVLEVDSRKVLKIRVAKAGPPEPVDSPQTTDEH